MKRLWIPVLQLVAASALLWSCRKSNNTFADYAAQISRPRNWSGTASSRMPNLSATSIDSEFTFSSWPIPDTVVAVQIKGSNAIEMMGTTLNFTGRDDAQHTISFSYSDMQSEGYTYLVYYYRADSMVYSTGWSHHQFYRDYSIHTD